MVELIKLFIKYRRVFIINFFLAVGIAVILFFSLPRKFRATAEIMPSLEPETIMSIGTSLTMANPLLSFMVTPADIYARILKSRSVIEPVIDKLDLQKKFKAKYKDVLIKKLQRAIEVKTYPEGLIEVSFEHRDKLLATQIVNQAISTLDSVNKYTVNTKGRELRLFLAQRLSEVKKELSSYQDSLKNLQQKYKFIELTDEYAVVAEKYTEFYANLLQNKTELELLEKLYGKDSRLSFVEQKREKIKILENYIIQMLNGKNKDNPSFGPGFALPFSRIPEVAKKYIMFLAEIEARKEVYAFLFSKYEEAKILEKKDTPTLSILSYATAPQKKSWPKGSYLVFISVIISFFVSILYVAFMENKELQDLWNYFKKEIAEDFSFFSRSSRRNL